MIWIIMVKHWLVYNWLYHYGQVLYTLVLYQIVLRNLETLFLIASLIQLVSSKKANFTIFSRFTGISSAVALSESKLFFNNILHFFIGLSDWRGQLNNPRESVIDSKYELKVFAIIMFSVKSYRFDSRQFLSHQGNACKKSTAYSFSKKYLNLGRSLNSKCSCLDSLI